MQRLPAWKKIRLLAGFGIIGWLMITVPFNSRQYAKENMLRFTKPDNSKLYDTTLSRLQFFDTKDSLDSIENKNINRLKAIGTGMGNNFAGVFEINDCLDGEKASPCTKYYLELQGFTTKPTSLFFIRDSRFYITNRAGNPKDTKKTKEVFVRMKIDDDSPVTSLLIPISGSNYKIYNWILDILSAIFVLFAINAGVILPLITFYNIARGHAFTRSNISRLRWVGWSLIIISLIPCIVSFIAGIVLMNKIPREIFFPYWLSIYENRGWLMGGVACLLLADAFKTGYDLKKEQELTI
jgi:hypothetical protein